MSSDDISGECELLLKLLLDPNFQIIGRTDSVLSIVCSQIDILFFSFAKRTDQNFKRETREGEDVDNFLLVITRPESYAPDLMSIVCCR